MPPPVYMQCGAKRHKIQSDPLTNEPFIIQDGHRINLKKIPKSNPTSLCKKAKQPQQVVTLVTNGTQTEQRKVLKFDVSTQAGSGQISLTDDFFQFLTRENNSENSQAKKQLIDISNLKTEKERIKFKFFCDLNDAIVFNASGNLPIHQSVIESNLLDLRKNSLILKAVQKDINVLNAHFQSCLHLAVTSNINEDVLIFVLDANSDINLQDSNGNTALHLAVESKRIEIVRILIEKAAETGLNVDVYNHDGYTPLMVACRNEFIEIVQVLLTYGSSPNITDLKSGRTSLFYAVELNNSTLVELLLKHGANTKIDNFVGINVHDAMFEIENVSAQIKLLVSNATSKRQNYTGEKPTRIVKKPKLDVEGKNACTLTDNSEPIILNKHLKKKGMFQ